MDLAYPVAPSRRLIRTLDAALAVWCVAWIVIGFAVGIQVRGLGTLATTVANAGHSLRAAEQPLHSLSNVPFVGPAIGRAVQGVETQLRQASANAIQSGEESKRRADSLSILLALSIALIPTVPVAALYVPLRVARVREVRAVRRALRESHGDPAFEQFLARRATQRLPFYQLRAVTDDPWRDLQVGNVRPLADAELARLGITRPARPARPHAGVPE
jgi:hypothetical protein